MKALISVVAVVVATLFVVGMIVAVGHDTSVLVSPPESVVEQFVRKLATGRYDVALQHLDDDAPAARERIRAASDMLRGRAGAIEQVVGTPGLLDGDRASANAVISTERAGEISMEFMLVRRAGSWRIVDF